MKNLHRIITFDELNGYLITFADRKEIPHRFKKELSSTGFGYVSLWTRIFDHIRIDLSDENRKNLGSTTIINVRTLHYMGRTIEEPHDQE
ncbi:hypothetical protein PIB30_099556 [Stylosanthes scabra]|uniref:Uncharacterized protein n=1 Tax=Stylosanthes scabra TaxID=79078 RepID=A0ABU6SZ99_9FABA|nr:hypothetical protein [Stylosanthes scabra]